MLLSFSGGYSRTCLWFGIYVTILLLPNWLNWWLTHAFCKIIPDTLHVLSEVKKVVWKIEQLWFRKQLVSYNSDVYRGPLSLYGYYSHDSETPVWLQWPLHRAHCAVLTVVCDRGRPTTEYAVVLCRAAGCEGACEKSDVPHTSHTESSGKEADI